MPVLSKKLREQIIDELDRRIGRLYVLLDGRELSSAKEGCKNRSHWISPELKCATIGQDYEIRLAVEDFKNILAEIKKLK